MPTPTPSPSAERVGRHTKTDRSVSRSPRTHLGGLAVLGVLPGIVAATASAGPRDPAAPEPLAAPAVVGLATGATRQRLDNLTDEQLADIANRTGLLATRIHAHRRALTAMLSGGPLIGRMPMAPMPLALAGEAAAGAGPCTGEDVLRSIDPPATTPVWWVPFPGLFLAPDVPESALQATATRAPITAVDR